MKPRVAVIDDLEPARQVMARVLGHEFTVPVYESVTAALAAFENDPPDVIITDLRMPGIDGLTGLRLFRDKGIDAPVIVMTAYASVETAVDAMKAGAFEYLRKPVDPEALELVVRRAAEHVGLRKENARLRRELQTSRSPQGIVGKSASMQQMLEVIERVAPSDVPVLIEGESGTGKDLVARAIHAQSRSVVEAVRRPEHARRCPESLAESELFGHEKGAFTGAATARHGFFAEAEGGTLFLDEIGALIPALQPKLLRVLAGRRRTSRWAAGRRSQGGRPHRLRDQRGSEGEGRVRRASARTSTTGSTWCRCACRRSASAARTSPCSPITSCSKHAQRLSRPPLPPSRRRRCARCSSTAGPGNVRELENAIERALLLAKGDSLRVEDLPPEVRTAESDGEDGTYRRERGRVGAPLSRPDAARGGAETWRRRPRSPACTGPRCTRSWRGSGW